MKTKRKVFIGAFIALFFPLITFADGMIRPWGDYHISESDQNAAIFYENGREDIILSVDFKGDAEKFGWIVPTPSKPDVKKAKKSVFTDLNEYTQPKDTLLTRFTNWVFDNNNYSGDYDYSKSIGAVPMMGGETAAPKVEVVAKKQVGPYDTVTLKAETGKDLDRWLAENGFDTVNSTDSSVIDEYIKASWYFVAMKINNDYQTNKTTADLNGSAITPIYLSFVTDRLIYPLKISSINQEAVTNYSSFKTYLSSQFYSDLRGKYSGSHMERSKISLFNEAGYREFKNIYENVGNKYANAWYEAQQAIKKKVEKIPTKELAAAATYLKYTPPDYERYANNKTISLYVFSDKKYMTDNYSGDISYAEKLSKNKVNSFLDSNTSKNKGFFLTKIVMSLSENDMKKDVLFTAENDRDEINSGQMNVSEWLLFLTLVPLVSLYAPTTLLLTKVPLAGICFFFVYFALYITTIVLAFVNPHLRKKLMFVLRAYFGVPVMVAGTFLLIITGNLESYLDGSDEITLFWIILPSVIISLIVSWLLALVAKRKRERVNEIEQMRQELAETKTELQEIKGQNLPEPEKEENE